MNWAIKLSKQASKFLEKNHKEEQIIKVVLRKGIKKLGGDNVNIDLKKLKAGWLGFYRIRQNKVRIIFAANFETKTIFVEAIDFRGNVYK